ncbi:MAG TPA: hypothetical protein VNZ22_18405 [Bacillota bacterium]|nr:hypothetical protein [Bacillota bacterium]
MKKIAPKGTKPKSDPHPQDKPERRCGNRLSKDALPGGDKEPPADRGACEEETSSQGSE